MLAGEMEARSAALATEENGEAEAMDAAAWMAASCERLEPSDLTKALASALAVPSSVVSRLAETVAGVAAALVLT